NTIYHLPQPQNNPGLLRQTHPVQEALAITIQRRAKNQIEKRQNLRNILPQVNRARTVFGSRGIAEWCCNHSFLHARTAGGRPPAPRYSSSALSKFSASSTLIIPFSNILRIFVCSSAEGPSLFLG